MQSIILIGDEPFNLDFIKALPKSVNTRSHEPNDLRYVLEYINDRIYYDYLPEGILDYEKDELLHLPFQSPRFIAMLYTSNQIMRDFFLENAKYLENIYIDNDLGEILLIHEFMYKLKV
ncbi:hypothetical protein QE450_003601 [Paenibacillus sp. SORGH_AS306]|uniref:hypothetical protein n=1 Tax=unclassified Paenibacillus TaxID=185978 RepID=UPI002786AF4D|nr:MULTISPECIES: hypothetical protein [unclassified Paenibacillus]MDQ1236103.1 hypothetical protein [Paenibacillus sp. SORGH_AS_0306]MDR6108458.1 hypothetical protein [Paenibacillus sp. SORGH_AS_0338]